MKSYSTDAYTETSERCYGIRATLSLPGQFSLDSAARSADIHSYIALINPLCPNDSRLKVGVIRCGSPRFWALFVWSPLPRFEGGIRREVEIELRPGRVYEFEVRFALNDHTRFELLVNSRLVWRDAFAKPVPRETYDGGGLNARFGVEASKADDTTSIDRMRWSHVYGAIDPSCKNWRPLIGTSIDEDSNQGVALSCSASPFSAFQVAEH